jgi:site-specific DNA recombinase
MNAAIHARKSNPEEDRHEEAKSVTRQKADARAYAEKKGWTVADAHVYEDDAISGRYGEDRRPGLKALLAAAERTPRPFDVIIAAKDDRLARDQWQAAIVLSRLYEAGVRLFYYQEDREVSLGDATGKFMEAVRGYASEAYRESVSRHMVDALKRKATAGHVHGGRVSGYDNVRVDGHVERRINEAEAAVVRSIFERFGRGERPRRIAQALSHEGAPTPGLAGGWRKGTAWTKGSVREVLLRELYQGMMRSRWGTEEIRVEQPALRIVPNDLWAAVQLRLAEQRQIYLRHTNGKLFGRPSNSVESRYLLTGLTACAACGSGLTVVSRPHGRKRAYFYQCLGNVRGRRSHPCRHRHCQDQRFHARARSPST